MDFQKLVLAFFSKSTFREARIAGLNEFLRQLEEAHYNLHLSGSELDQELDKLISEAQALLEQAHQSTEED